ncbi:MAG: hypothetical protein L0H26_06975, partial [Microlunatus sp.]|nr:hypothetical protein [Microlunatus sp.]
MFFSFGASVWSPFTVARRSFGRQAGGFVGVALGFGVLGAALAFGVVEVAAFGAGLAAGKVAAVVAVEADGVAGVLIDWLGDALAPDGLVASLTGTTGAGVGLVAGATTGGGD